MEEQPAKNHQQEKAKKAEDTIPDDELPISKSILIKSPGQAKVPDQIAAVRAAIKGKDLDEEQVRKFRKIEIPDDEDGKTLKPEDKIRIKDLYKEGVWKKATPQKGGG